MPRFASPTQPSISDGDRPKDRLASATVVLPWIVSIARAVCRFAVHHLMLSSIVILIATFSLDA